MRITNLLKLLRISYKPAIARRYSEEAPKALRSLKAKSTRNTVQFYVDSCRVRTVAGNGGDGCISFLSVWCKDQAGPDGGDGGNGGHVIFQASHSVRSLNHVRSVVTAPHGERGYNKDCTGKNAQHVVIPVPLGTIVKDQCGRVLADLSAEGGMFVGARGGAGGRGNRFFLTDTEQAPSIAELGAIGECISYQLEVRSMAHVGLLGCPNAGKSTLLRAVTRARPKVAPHAFTTVRPHLGMIPYSDYEQIAMADLPGLIEGSHRNRGLGIQFLQHVERCRGLVFLLDGTNCPLDQYHTLTYELTQYNPTLMERPKIIVVNKCDLEEGREGLEEVRRELGSLEDSLKEGSVGVGSLASRKNESLGEVCSLDASLERKLGGGNSLGDEGVNTSVRGTEGSCISGDMESLGEKRSFEDEKGNSGLDNAQNSSLCKDIVGISAKTGGNIDEFLKLVRVLYDSGGKDDV